MPGETNVIQHRVKLTIDIPIRCKTYPLPYAMREELWKEVDSMLEMRVVRPSTSTYASPIVMVKKNQFSSISFVKLKTKAVTPLSVVCG